MGQEYSWADHWEVFEWFKASNSLHHWILLVLIELKDSSEQSRYILEESLKDLKDEIEEIFDNTQESPDEDLKIIGKCHCCISTPNDEKLRQSLLNEILHQAKLPDGWLPYLTQITDSQRSVLRTKIHLNIQTTVAYIRAISKPHLDSKGYHYTKNPYYRQVMNEKNDINYKYNELLAKNNAERSNSNQGSSHDDEGDEGTLQKKVEKMNKQFEREFERINQQLLENMKINDKNTQSNAQILESVKENTKINTFILNNTQQMNAQILEKMKENKMTNARILESTQNLKSLDLECDRLFKENEFYKKESENIKNQLTNAEKKALNLEAALGDATNVRLSDESPNNSLQLNKDITKFKKLVENFIKVKGKSTVIRIKEQATNDLLSKYKFKKNNDTFKDVLGFILQSIIIDKVFSAIENIRNKNGNSNCLETAIMNYTHEIIKWTTELYQTRDGDDHVTKMIPIKIRQQIYEALALRGFNNSNNKFINSIRDNIVNEMNKYREILDEGRKKNICKNADELVRTGIKLWFCLKIQEPEVNIEWYKPGEAVNTNFMEGPWELDDANNSVVELCYFPCILSKGTETEVYYKSQVTIQKKPQGAWNIINKLVY